MPKSVTRQFTLTELADEAEREMRMRYAGKMRKDVAQREIAMMREIAYLLHFLAEEAVETGVEPEQQKRQSARDPENEFGFGMLAGAIFAFVPAAVMISAFYMGASPGSIRWRFIEFLYLWLWPFVRGLSIIGLAVAGGFVFIATCILVVALWNKIRGK